MKDQLELTIRRMSDELYSSEIAADRMADQLCSAEIEQRTAVSLLDESNKNIEDLQMTVISAQNKIAALERIKLEQEEKVFICAWLVSKY